MRRLWNSVRGSKPRLALALVVVTSLGIAVPILTNARTTAAASTCAPVIFIGVRGSGEDPGLGRPVGEVARLLGQGTSAGNIDFRVLDYPAQAIASWWLFTSGGTVYTDSVAVGVSGLQAQVLGLVNSCSTSMFVLAGYSQGAEVITDFLALPNQDLRLASAIRERIIAVALFGSPLFAPADGSKINVKPSGRNGYSDALGGIVRSDPITEPSVLSNWTSTVKSYCSRGDGICQNDTGSNVASLLLSSSPHYHYDTSYAPDAADFIGGRVRAMLRKEFPQPVPGVLTLDRFPMPYALVGVPYQFTFTATGGRAPLAWQIGGLPKGTHVNGPSISGVFNTVGDIPVLVQVTDAIGQTDSAQFQLPVAQSRNDTVLLVGKDPVQNTTTGSEKVAIGLMAAGYAVSQAVSLPADAETYGSIWWIRDEAMPAADADRLIAYVEAGGSVLLTGEMFFAQEWNDAIQPMISALVINQQIVVGSLDVPYCVQGSRCDISASVVGGIATQPNILTGWAPIGPGVLTGVSAENVLAVGVPVSGIGPLPVIAAAWDSPQLRGPGRLVVLMDIDWMNVIDDRFTPWNEPFMENLAAFLARH